MVDMGNPLTRTTAGKVNLADALAERNMIDNPDQYIQVVTTGRLEPVIEGKQAELLLIKSENEELADGKPQIAIVTDRHDQHILEHKTVLANPDVRRDPQSTAILQATLNHIQEHVNFLKTTDPVLLQLLKEQSFAPPPAPPQGAASPGQMLNAQNPVTQQAANVKQPNMPQPPHGTDPNSAAIIQGGGVPQSA
jgi:hypothetical protein